LPPPPFVCRERFETRGRAGRETTSAVDDSWTLNPYKHTYIHRKKCRFVSSKGYLSVCDGTLSRQCVSFKGELRNKKFIPANKPNSCLPFTSYLGSEKFVQYRRIMDIC
jgi:hypothetical protein